MARPTGREFSVRLESMGAPPSLRREPRAGSDERFEFHVSKHARDLYGLSGAPYSSSGDVVFADYGAARSFSDRINERARSSGGPFVKAGAVNAMALIHEILHAVCAEYRERVEPAAFDLAVRGARAAQGTAASDSSLLSFAKAFPPSTVYAGTESPESWLDGLSDGRGKRAVAMEELLLLRLANENPALAPYRFLFDDAALKARAPVAATLDAAEAALASLPPFGPDGEDLPSLLRAPMRASPHSLSGQLEFMRKRWGLLLGDRMPRLLGGFAMLAEDERPSFPPGPGPVRVPSYAAVDSEYERFSEDKDWMPRVVMIAKSALVWLDQLSRAYGRDIRTLDAIPDEELDTLASRGLNALWLIGIWERSQASRRIKELCGNPEAAASAYSLFDYEIAWELGGWPALENLRGRAQARGIRLAADMVPNHTGLDSTWVRDRPDLFISRSTPPFPSYSYTGENLSDDGSIGLWIEDHYYDRRDAAVTFKRVDFRTGHTSYVYHGNDGTSMPWNDTAQIDFLNPAAREAVKERILHVARNFPIIRFDAAMVLAKRSLRRLWYPEPGAGGAIASRFEYALDAQAFNAAIPDEFWREVVDTCAAEAPETLLLAEAFWMMEGYFVRTLGMHRVYNSAFMNMLKEKKNAEYRATIRNTIEFDKDILKRFVNFMNNPDEDTAVAQFGSGDHYFGVCSMMATMPGLPMFGHGQFEGFTEKYGMEYRRAYKDERPDEGLVRRHEREIVPLLKRRHLFSGVENFLLYDLARDGGSVDENVFAYSNGSGGERALVLFNNAWERTSGRIRRSCAFADKNPGGSRTGVTRGLAEGLGLRGGDRFVVMTETRSALRFIRRSRDIAENGLAVALEGFQCQVFMDIAEVDDDESGSYAALCDFLGGSGVKDIGWALQDLELGELYRAWAAAFGPGYFLRALRAATARPEPDSGFAAGLEAGPEPETGLEKFFSTASRFAASESFAVSGASPEALSRAYAPVADAALAAASSLLGLGAALSAPREAPGAAEAIACFAALLPLAFLLGDLDDSSAARGLAESWGMPRKLREALAEAGVEPGTAETAAAFAVAALGRLDLVAPAGAERLAALSPKEAAEALMKDDEAKDLLGVNRWDGRTWFDADRYRLCSTLLAAAASGLGADAALARAALDRMDAAALAAGWCLEAMIAGDSKTRTPPRAAKKKTKGEE
ncbi:MAG: alpha-amylase [Spirochaetes bacterium]|nr:alpha-amylase [Spirochaetota bacterium]MBU1081709.1 alpha-amylase [Spirochaetota bacterium]